MSPFTLEWVNDALDSDSPPVQLHRLALELAALDESVVRALALDAYQHTPPGWWGDHCDACDDPETGCGILSLEGRFSHLSETDRQVVVDDSRRIRLLRQAAARPDEPAP